MPTAPVAALSLIAGFAVAQATGVRPLGGIVLAAAVAWCFVRWREVSAARAVLLVVIYAGAFAASHALADPLGTWGAVLTVATVTGLAAWLLSDRAGSGGGAGTDRAGRSRGRRAA